MTDTARLVLNDLERALEILEDCKSDQDWRIMWLSAIALARMVGHVLDKVDAEDDPELRANSNKAFRAWMDPDKTEHTIFREFIKLERDSVIHQYASAVIDSDVVPVSVMGNGEEEVSVLDENLYRPIVSGKFEGLDARDLLADAIIWWRSELSELDGGV